MPVEYVPIIHFTDIHRAQPGEPAWHVEWDGPAVDLPAMVVGCTHESARNLCRSLMLDNSVTRVVAYLIEG